MVKLPSEAGFVGSCSVGVFNTFEIEIECPANTAISNNSAQLFHSVVGDLSPSGQKFDNPGRGEKSASSDSLTRSALLALCYDLAKQGELANVCELTELYLMT